MVFLRNQRSIKKNNENNKYLKDNIFHYTWFSYIFIYCQYFHMEKDNV
jgi:hypothetical protein